MPGDSQQYKGVVRLRLTLEDPEPSCRREELGEVRCGGKVIDIERLRRRKGPDEER